MPSRESSLRNLEKARAKWRPPRRWRSYQETRIIRRLVWQWFTYRGPGKWSGRAVGRRLGVSHTYIQKLVREFAIDPSKMQRQQRTYGEANFEHLIRAQELTRQERARGYLRSPRYWKIAEITVGGNPVRAVMRTKASITLPAAYEPSLQGAPPPWAIDRMPSYRSRIHPRRRRWRPGMPSW